MEGAGRMGEIFQGSIVKAFSNRTLSLASRIPPGPFPGVTLLRPGCSEALTFGGPALSGDKECRREGSRGQTKTVTGY